jgi:hypothetical protein
MKSTFLKARRPQTTGSLLTIYFLCSQIQVTSESVIFLLLSFFALEEYIPI